VIMDRVVLGEECIVGALSFLKADDIFEKRSLIVGNPAKKIKEVTDEMINWKTSGTKLYQALPGQMREGWRVTEPLREIPKNRPVQETMYTTWNELRKQDDK
jgi:phenylacetic acid degradation protein